MRIQAIIVAVIICICSLNITYKASALAQRGDNMRAVKMSYRLEGAYSVYKYIEVEISGAGQGVIRFAKYPKNKKQGAAQEETVNFKLDKTTIENLIRLYNEVNFFSLTLNDLNKDKIQVVDVGTTTLMFNNGDKQRTLSYGYVENNPLQNILEIYWKLFEQNTAKK